MPWKKAAPIAGSVSLPDSADLKGHPRKKAVRKARKATQPAPESGTVTVETRDSKEGTPTEVSRREKIALLAYSYWEQRGYQGGSPEEDWYRAEREIDFGTSM